MKYLRYDNFEKGEQLVPCKKPRCNRAGYDQVLASYAELSEPQDGQQVVPAENLQFRPE